MEKCARTGGGCLVLMFYLTAGFEVFYIKHLNTENSIT
jgi:hypothetical protein